MIQFELPEPTSVNCFQTFPCVRSVVLMRLFHKDGGIDLRLLIVLLNPGRLSFFV